MANPKDPDSLSLAGSSSPGPSGNKPDFSNVKGGVKSTEAQAPKADFSNVQSKVTSTEEMVSGGGAQQTYTVERGDNLSSISKRFYGKSKYWKQIFDANRDTIENPDLIYPGQTIRLPAIEDGDDE